MNTLGTFAIRLLPGFTAYLQARLSGQSTVGTSKSSKSKSTYPCPEIIGIDEHTIHKGYKFATTIADLSHHRIYDVIKGKRHIDIEGALMSYKGRGKSKSRLYGFIKRIPKHCKKMLSKC